MKKLTLILDNTNWLEAIWIENETQVYCESYSGHKEHIAMLRNKALEFKTSLDEYESLIAECESKFVYPIDEEMQSEEIAMKVQEYKSYLASTDYKMTVDYFAALTVDMQNELTTKRAEAREYVRANS